MKLRWVEREVFVPEKKYGEDIGIVTKVKVLQYWEIPTNGKETWVDVPLEVEEV